MKFLRNSENRVVGLLGVSRDLTERKMAEKALKESEERFRTVTEKSPNMVYINKNGRVVYINDQCREIMGYDKDEVYSPEFSFLSLIAPEFLNQAEMSFNKHMENIEVPPLEYTLIKKDGGKIYTTINTKLIDYEGERAILGVLTDITDQKEYENLLITAKKEWEATFDAVSDWITIIDKDHNIIRSNKASKKLFNLSPKHAIGKRCYEIVHATDYPVTDCPLEKVLNGGHPGFMEFQAEDDRWLNISVYPIKMENDDELFVHTVRDVTDIKHAEAEKANFEAQYRQLYKTESLARMAGAIAHHFNNQLSVVRGNLELAIEDVPADAAIRDYLEDAIQAAHRSSDISGLMLTYLGHNPGTGTYLDLSEVCRNNLPMLRDAVQKNITLETNFMETGPVIHASPNQMRQILNHLVINAAEAIGDRKGRVRISIRSFPASDIPPGYVAPVAWKPDAESYACLEVTDTGCGISDQDMENLFDPFFSTKFTGRGIGLTVVIGVVKALDGAVSVKTRKDYGSTFRILLPIVKGKVPQKSQKAVRVHKKKDGGAVLLVEDQAPVRKMAAIMLKGLGFTVLTAEGGAEALELFQKQRGMIRCVITDLTMPGMDGWDTLLALRKIRPDLPVILASGYDEAQAMGRDDSVRPNAFLQKPYSLDELENALSQALQEEG